MSICVTDTAGVFKSSGEPQPSRPQLSDTLASASTASPARPGEDNINRNVPGSALVSLSPLSASAPEDAREDSAFKSSGGVSCSQSPSASSDDAITTSSSTMPMPSQIPSSSYLLGPQYAPMHIRT